MDSNITDNNNNVTMGTVVKSEPRTDDREINEMAKRIIEQNKQRPHNNLECIQDILVCLDLVCQVCHHIIKIDQARLQELRPQQQLQQR